MQRGFEHAPKGPWLTLEFSGDNSYLRSEVEISQMLLDKLSEAQINTDQILICGAEGRLINEIGTFGDRKTTFAVSAQELLSAASQMDEYGSTVLQYPIRYANECEEPVLVIFDANMFEVTDIRIEGDTEWSLVGGTMMDAAVKAVVKII